METAEVRKLSDQIVTLAGAELMSAHNSVKELADDAENIGAIHGHMIGVVAATIYSRATSLAEMVKVEPEKWQEGLIEQVAGDLATYAGRLTNFALWWYMQQARFIEIAAFALLLQHLASQVVELVAYEETRF
jgi:hypothetical protein